MKVVILAGGYGTRIEEESRFKPKPMVEIGGRPVLWHIMKLYSHYGFSDFVICAGYKQEVIKQYFFDYHLRNSDVTIDLRTNGIEIHNNVSEPWKVTIVDTGLDTMTGGRVKRVRPYLNGERFFLTYGDGVSNVDIAKLLAFHEESGAKVTISAYNAEQRFGVLDIADTGMVRDFREKSYNDGSPINIGFMVCENDFIDFIDGDDTVLEKTPMRRAIEANALAAYRHDGWWGCMDTLREKNKLEELWSTGKAPWRVW